MKKTRVVLSVVLIIFVCFAWITQIKGAIDENRMYQSGLNKAVALQEKGLYQKAIASYEEVLSIKEKPEVRASWMETYRLAYIEGTMSASQYESALQKMCEVYPDDAVHWEQLLRFYLDRGSYNSARNTYKKCVKAEVYSDALGELFQEVRYAFKLKSKTYTDFTRSPDGYYTVNDGANWMSLTTTGDRLSQNAYNYVGPFNSSVQTVYVSEEKQCLYNSNGVIEAILTKDFVQTGAYGNGVIPLKIRDKEWRFLDCATDEFRGDAYSAVSNYTDGIAAVCKNGKWTLVDGSQQPVNAAEFDNVKLHGNLDYVYDEIMIASAGGTYRIYDKEGNAASDFACPDADVYLGSYIAYQDANGKWGYVDKEGSVVIEPDFENAKSFSNNLAAVQQDGKWGFVNTSGDIVIDCQFRDADYFNKTGVCMVSVDDGEYCLLQLRYLEN